MWRIYYKHNGLTNVGQVQWVTYFEHIVVCRAADESRSYKRRSSRRWSTNIDVNSRRYQPRSDLTLCNRHTHRQLWHVTDMGICLVWSSPLISTAKIHYTSFLVDSPQQIRNKLATSHLWGSYEKNVSNGLWAKLKHLMLLMPVSWQIC